MLHRTLFTDIITQQKLLRDMDTIPISPNHKDNEKEQKMLLKDHHFGSSAGLKRNLEALIASAADADAIRPANPWHFDDDETDDTASETVSGKAEDTEDEEETETARALVKAAFSRTLSSSVLSRLIGTNNLSQQPERKKQRIESELPKQPMNRLPFVASMPILSINASKTRTPQQTHFKVSIEKPDDVLRSCLKANGYSVKTFDALGLDNFFETLSPEAIESYDMELVTAVRQEDIDALRKLYGNGRTMHCGNKFGESITHMACRRASVKVLSFLLYEAGVTTRLCCDYGRTPLHDACWTTSPNFQLIDMLIDACPDLLYIKDKRGFTPLDYVQSEYWKDWSQYLLGRNPADLTPRELY